MSFSSGWEAVRLHTRRTLFVVVVSTFVPMLAACGGGGGGGGGSSTPPGPTPVPIPTASPVPACSVPCATSSSALASNANSAQAVRLPAFAGVSGSVTFPAGTQVQGGSATLLVTLQSTTSGFPALQSVLRRPSAVGVTNAQLYVVMQPSQTITLPAYPSFTFAAPASLVLPGENEFLAFFDPAQNGYRTLVGPVAGSSGTVAFTGPAAPHVLTGGQTYVFALYGIPVPTPGNPIPSPASVGFNLTGQTQIVSVTEQNYTGVFSAHSNDTSVVTVTPSSATTFVLTAGTKGGTTSVVVTDSGGRTSLIDVGVTITIGTIR